MSFNGTMFWKSLSHGCSLTNACESHVSHVSLKEPWVGTLMGLCDVLNHQRTDCSI